MKNFALKSFMVVTLALLCIVQLGMPQRVMASAPPVALYLNGVIGNDNNDGSTKETAVKTFAKAKELAAAIPGKSEILVTGTVSVEGDISLEGTNSMLKREGTFNGYLLRVASGKTATLSNITVDGNEGNKTDVGGVPQATSSLITCSGTLNITDGAVLQNNKIAHATKRRSGGAVYCYGGTVNMTGGVMQSNTATFGGGVYIKNNGKFNMSGGSIEKNAAISGPTPWNDAAAGGGVCIIDGGTFDLSGNALIQNNSSEEVGGGISIGNMEVSFGNNELHMTGGTIDGNTSGATGGGVFVQAAYGNRKSQATITAGNITNNKMLGTGVTNYAFGGGGIYVNGYDYWGFSNGQLFLENVVITDNEAKFQGGGYAGCPISNTKIYLKDGGALYRNNANGGKEVFIYSDTRSVWGAHAGNPEYFVSQTMLGDVPYNWKYDDGSEVPLNKLQGILMGDGRSLNLNTDEVGNANTDSLAKVFISGNYSATRGGGIGTNGDVTIGRVNPDDIAISVTKTWNHGVNIDIPKNIKVELYRKTAVGTDEYVGHFLIEPDKYGLWKLTFEGLPKTDKNGNEYQYSIKEIKVPDYITEMTGDFTSGFSIANTYKKEYIEISGKKIWDDANNQDGKRPSSITINLYKQVGTAAPVLHKSEIVTADTSGKWTWKFSDLPKYESGTEIVYSITEDAVIDYTTSLDGYNITNSHTPGKINIKVTKVWDDNNNQDGARPQVVTVKLLADGIYTGRKLVLTEANNWTDTFTELYIFKPGEVGQKVVYTVEEDTVGRNYTTVVTGTATSGYTITNTRTPEKIDISGGKTWDDSDNQDAKRPDSITVKLLANGEEIAVKTVTASDGWKWKFTGLDKYKEGELIAYSVSENAVDGYSTNVYGYDITNSYTPGKTSIQVTKAWDDNNNQDGKRPGSVIIKLFADGEDTGKTLILVQANNWTGTFNDLDVYKGGNLIKYTILEEPVGSGYDSTMSGDVANGYTLINSRMPPEVTMIFGAKTWDDANNQDGVRPSSITIRLLANGKEKAVKEVTQADNWAWKFKNLPKYEKGTPIAYTVTEDAIDEYSSVVSGYNVTNSYTPKKTSLQVTKAWADCNNQDGVRPKNATIKLFADGEDTGKTLVLTAKNNWTGTFSELYVFKPGEVGKRVIYTVKEVPVGYGYATVITGDAKKGYVITNARTPETVDVIGSKTWDDADNQDDKRPDSITVKLLKNGLLIAIKNVTAADNWAWSFKDLAKYEAGTEIKYTITEDTIDEYSAIVSGYDITNSYTPGKTSVHVTKAWVDKSNQDGARPNSVNVKLLADGKDTGKTLALTAANSWTGTFADLDIFKPGEVAKKIVYTVKEEPACDGYTTVATGTAKAGYTITNARTPETIDISGGKTWADSDNRDAKRPASIIIRLIANDIEIDSRIVTEADNWAWSFNELPKCEAGKEISYVIVEDAIDGYSSVVSGYDVTNSYAHATTEVLVNKVWDDANNKYGTRPNKVTVQLYANGKLVEGMALTLNEANGWAGKYINLPKFEKGKEITYTVDEKEVPNGYAKTVVSSAEGTKITNTYEKPYVPPTQSYPKIRVPLNVKKVLENGVLKGGEYEFILTDGDGKQKKATNNADGTVNFPDRTFSEVVSNYTYTVHEVKGNDPDILYDNTVYTVKVTTKAVDGKLVARVDIEKDGIPYDGEIVFTNCKEMPPTGDNIYQLLTLLLTVAFISLGGAYMFKRRQKSRS